MDTTITRGERTRRAIITAAYRLFVKQGFRATSMRQIATRSNTSLSNIYNHFESKKHIFETVVIERHPFRRVLQILEDTPGETMEEFVGNSARLIINELRNHPDSLNLVLIGITEFKGELAPELPGAFLPQALALFERFSGAQGRLRDLPLEAILLSFLSTVLACYMSAKLTDPGGSNLPVLEPQLDILYHGIMKAEKP
jgi:AcrR family transcriptional regulator